jgi:hypothetical protein
LEQVNYLVLVIKNNKENRLAKPKMSHNQSGGTTHARVTQIKMAWLILDTERCGGTRQIYVAIDIHVKVSHVNEFSVTVENHDIYLAEKS